MQPFPNRQVHLDFHTSEAIPGIGSEWDKKHFQQMLQLGHVASITIFSKCHHGWSYHPTDVPLSRMHPHLDFDLMGAMIEAAHEIGVQTPMYISAGLDEKLVETHTQWLRRLPNGSTTWVGWMEAGYHEFCMRSPYLDYLVEQTEEVVNNYDGEGVFFDIVGPRPCCCQYCIAEMYARGWDPRDPQAQTALGRDTYLQYARRINAAVHAIKPDLRIFHNAGHITRGDRELTEVTTHLELESLPTGGWGYDHFRISARYAQDLGKEVVGQTGKFHTSWGEFGGYKHPNALRYEASVALANGSKIGVGDQLHPYGKLDQATYRLIGTAFSEVKEKEPWCFGATSVADVGLLTLEALTGANNVLGPSGSTGITDAGAVRMLQEGGILYDVIDLESDFSRYAVIILPDAFVIDAALQDKLTAYLAQGGKLFATGKSGLDPQLQRFALDFGVDYQGEGAMRPCYLLPHFALRDWDPAAFVVYSTLEEITPTSAEVLVTRQDSFFNRDYLHFCSHQHTPVKPVDAGAAIVKTAQTVYCAFPAFRCYAEMGQTVLREIILSALRTLLPQPTLTTSLPSMGLHTVQRQAEAGRTVVHLIYGSPVKRGQGIEVVEDLVPLSNVTVNLAMATPPSRVYLAPQQEALPFTVADGIVSTTVPQVECHQMVVFEG